MIYACIDCGKVRTQDRVPKGWEHTDEYTICSRCLKEQIERALEDDAGYGGLTGCRDYCDWCRC